MRISLLFVVSALAACGSDSTPEPLSEPLVVYANAVDEVILRKRFAEFTDDTGVPVMFKFGDSSANADLVIANLGSPPADILLADNVADIWRAAEQGALRPMRADSIRDLPSTLRDPDGLWAALAVRYAVIEMAGGMAEAEVPTYEALAAPELRGQVCLSSSSLTVNRSLMAMLIEDLGRRPAELMVRGWVSNLAVPPFATEAKLREAVESGDCRYAILSQPYASDQQSFYIDIDGIGIGRHARYPALAHQFVQWAMQRSELTAFDGANGKNVGIAGWRDEEAVLLAERAGYR